MSGRMGNIDTANRNAKGQLLPGNTVTKSKKHKDTALIYSLQDALRECVCVDKTVAIMNVFYELATSSPDDKIRIAAGVTWLDRAYGKPKVSVELTPTNTEAQDVPVDLTPEQLLQVTAAINMLHNVRTPTPLPENYLEPRPLSAHIESQETEEDAHNGE